MVEKSIKDFNTTGMELWEREKLFKETVPIQIGEIVYRSGDFAGSTTIVKVTEENQKIISMFWNSLYFDNQKAADRVTQQAHAAYGDYQAEAIGGWVSAMKASGRW